MEKGVLNLEEMQRYRYKHCSQIDEDGILEYIFMKIGTEPLKMFVEIGVSPSVVGDRKGKLEANSVHLRNNGWVGWMIDGVKQDEQFGVNKAFITPENVCRTLGDIGCPRKFDLFSIDIDSLEYYVLGSFLKEFTPRVVVSEYNCIYEDKRVVSRTKDFNWGGDYFGVSCPLLRDLMAEHNYTMVHNNRVNAFFVHNDELTDECKTSLSGLKPEFYALYPITSKSSDWNILV